MVKPLPLLHEDGSVIPCFQGILDRGGRSTVKVAKVNGHATDEMVEDGRVRWQDKDENEAGDRPADLARRRQPA